MNFPKFRIFDKSQNKYLTICIDYYTLKYQGDVWLLCPSHLDKYWPFVAISNNENFVLEQYTGLKDKNRKEIYEGDIIKWNTPDFFDGGSYIDREFIQEVTFRGSAFYPVCEFPTEFFTEGSIEILGNINQNPELLK